VTHCTIIYLPPTLFAEHTILAPLDNGNPGVSKQPDQKNRETIGCSVQEIVHLKNLMNPVGMKMSLVTFLAQ